MERLLYSDRDYVDEEGDIKPVDTNTKDETALSRGDWSEWAEEAADSEPLEYGPTAIKVRWEEGPSVSLRARAISLRAIMGYFNQANKVRGMEESRDFSGFDRRYGAKASKVANGMASKQESLHEGYRDSLDTLMAGYAMSEAGFSSEEIERGRRELAKDLRRAYGPGRAYASDREKLVRKADRTVRIVVDGKKR